VQRLFDAVDELAAQDVTTMPLVEDLTALEQVRARLDAECARRIAAMTHTGEHQVHGYKTVAALLVRRLHAHGGEARARAFIARQVEQLPTTGRAWLRGEITSRHVDVIARAREAAKADEQFAEFEAALLRVARNGTPKDVSDAAQAWRDALDNDLGRDGSETRAGELRDQRAARYHELLDGVHHLDATFEGDGAKIAKRAIERAYERGHRANDPRTPAQQRADAIVDIFSAYLAGLPRSGNAPHLLVLTDAETLAGEAVGCAHTDDGTRLDPATVRRLACRAFVQDVLLGQDGVPLALGRAKRRFSPDQYRAMVVRDRGCRGPTCDAPPDQCNPHHLDEWVADDGPTDLDNGALFCEHGCHRDLHDGTMRVEGGPNGELKFYDRVGNLLGVTEPRTPPCKVRTKQGKRRENEQKIIAARLQQLLDQRDAVA
jgi:hypothetical protein